MGLRVRERVREWECWSESGSEGGREGECGE